MGWFAMQRMLCVWFIVWTSLLGCALSWDISSRVKSKRVDKLHPKSPLTNGGADETSSSYFFSQKSFQTIGLSDKMVGVVEVMHINRPSKIQALSFSTILSGKHAVLGDQTGSGKTLAYLLPIVQRMEERLSEGKLQRSPERAPYVVVMTPTTELAGQVAAVVREMANALKFRSSCFTSASDFDAEQKRLRLGSEVLVTTPGRLMELLKRKEISLSNVQSIVLDEVDVLFQDDTFPLPPIGQACPPTAQFIFTSATLPQSVVQQISKEFSDVVVLTGPGLHRVSPAVEEVLVDCSGPNTQSRSLNFVRENKQVALEKALETVSAERTLIFCNTIDNCRLVENNLQRRLKGKLVLPYHSAIDPKKRVDNLAAFCRPLLKQPAILICTDRASRGIDFDRSFVDHVILWDFPREPSEYLRRVGRTGRAGRPGRATVFAYGKQVDAAKAVIRASVDGKKIEPENERTFQEHSLRSEVSRSSPSVSPSVSFSIRPNPDHGQSAGNSPRDW